MHRGSLWVAPSAEFLQLPPQSPLDSSEMSMASTHSSKSPRAPLRKTTHPIASRISLHAILPEPSIYKRFQVMSRECHIHAILDSIIINIEVEKNIFLEIVTRIFTDDCTTFGSIMQTLREDSSVRRERNNLQCMH